MQQKFVKHTVSDSKTIIDFIPKNKIEQDHKKKLLELLGVKRKGDWILVAEICGIGSKNAEVAFSRVYSKHHNIVVETLEKIIENRKQMLSK